MNLQISGERSTKQHKAASDVAVDTLRKVEIVAEWCRRAVLRKETKLNVTRYLGVVAVRVAI